MQSTLEVVKLRDGQLDDAAALLARAFFDDPLMTYAMPDEDLRQRALAPLMRVGVCLAQPGGEVYTSADPMQGVAVWALPGKNEFPAEVIAAAGGAVADEVMGPKAAARFNGALAQLGELHRRDMPDDHWYLMLLGVEPARQGIGIGGRLITPMLRRADATGLCCYLDTLKSRNVAFYRKHGFEVVVEGVLPDGPPFWTMRRTPR